MFSPREIEIEVVAADDDTVLVSIYTPVGVIELLGIVRRTGRVLYVRRAHVGGLAPGAVGRTGLNAIGRKLLEDADVDEIVIEGSARSTGRRKGCVPRVIRFPKG